MRRSYRREMVDLVKIGPEKGRECFERVLNFPPIGKNKIGRERERNDSRWDLIRANFCNLYLLRFCSRVKIARFF